MARQFRPGQLQTGSLYNISSSYALTASFALNGGGTSIDTGSFLTTASFNSFTASYSSGSFTGSFTGDGSQLTGIVSSKWTGSNPISRQGDVEITGSLRVQGSITGSLFGTASWATNAITSSFVTASNIYGPYGSNSITSASYAATASYSKNLQISGSVNNVDYIDFNTGSATPAWKSGRVFWDNTDGALSVYNAEADITLQVGQENWTRVSNRTGTTITNGTVVRLIGAHGDVPEVERAQSLLVSGSVNVLNQILGVATHDIEDNSKGFVTTQGLVRGLNTSAFNDGDTLFVGTGSAGVLQNTAPQAPYEIIPVGVCVKASPGGSGMIYVAVQEPIDFSDLSSVLVEGIYHYGDLWTYVQSGSTGVWTHTNQLSGSYGLTGSLTATSFTGSLFGTASWAQNAVTASYALYAVSASYEINYETSSSYAETASIAGFASTASYVLQAVSASFASTASFVNPLNQNVIITGSVNITQNLTSSRAYISSSTGTISGSTLTVFGSGSALPVFTVQGSQGELFSITDSLSGSLFSVNDISGLPILEVFSDNTTLIGNYLDPMLITTAKTVQTNSGSFVLYSLPTASYDTAFFEYSVKSGSNARAGTIMAIQSGSTVNFTETTTTDFGNTSAVSFGVFITGSNMALTGSSTSGAWTTKCIIRGI